VRSDARLLVIDGTTFEAMLRARPEIALRMIRALATRLDSANHHVELLLLPTADHRVVQCLRHLAEEELQRTRGPSGIDQSRSARATLAPEPSLAPVDAAPFVTAVLVARRIEDIAERVGLPVHEVSEVIERLRAAQLVVAARDAGIAGDGFVVPEVGRLLEFLEYFELGHLKERLG